MAAQSDQTAGAWEALVTPAQLQAALGAPALCILDCRFDLAHPALGAEQYREAHICGAQYAHLDRDLAGSRTGSNGRHPLPEPAALVRRLRQWGIGSNTQVVAYDASEGSFAARAWWLLRWLGHVQVAILDGGWQAWLAAGYETTDEIPEPLPGNICAGLSLQGVANLEVVAASRAAGAGGPHLLLDARAPDRYEGRNETVDPVAGHIPGAVNRFWKNNLRADGHFKDATTLRTEYEALLAGRAPTQVVVQCGSGVTACHNLLAMQVAGLPGAALFPGSWSQWIADPSRPIATGPNP